MIDSRGALIVLVTIFGLLFFGITSFADITNYSYDTMGRLIQVVYGDGSTIEYTYDKMGNRLQKNVYAAGSFNCSTERVKIEGNADPFMTITSALTVAQNGDTVKARNLIFSESLAINKDLILDGGYKCDFSGIEGYTSLMGNLSIENGGQLTISNFIIK